MYISILFKHTIGTFHYKMSNFDFTSIGHILTEPKNSKHTVDGSKILPKNSIDLIKSRLRTFCEKLFETLSVMSLKESFKGIDGSLFLGDKKALLEKFDLFFQNLVPSIDTFSKFIDCILQKSADDTDDIRFEVQNHVEKVVWNKFVYMDLLSKYGDEYVTLIVENKKVLYYLFCLFNRFATKANPGENPGSILLNSKRANFIFKKLDNSETVINKCKDDLNLEGFLKIFFAEDIVKQLFVNIKAVFNEYVKDLIKDELATCRVVPMMNRQSLTSFSSSLYSMQNCLFNRFCFR